MDNANKLKLAKKYYESNKERYEEFAKTIFENEGPKLDSNIKLDFNNRIKYSAYYLPPHIIRVNILYMISKLFGLNPKQDESIIDQYTKAYIINAIVHEKHHAIQFCPMRFAGKGSAIDGKAKNYYEFPVRRMEYKYVMSNLDSLSNKYNINRYILQNLIINQRLLSLIIGKIFRKGSMYNKLKHGLYKGGIYLDKQFERDVMGDNYYRSFIDVTFDNDDFSYRVKKGNHWNFKSMILIYAKAKNHSIKIISGYI